MKIECRLKREGGSDINIGGVVYKFRPNDEGQHVCEVGNDAHAQRFLSITEAYKIPGAEDTVPVVEEADVIDELNTPSAMLDDESVLAYLTEELGIEDPTDLEELIEYGDEVLGINVANVEAGTVMDVARRIIDNQPDPESDEDEEMTDVEVLTYVVDEFDIADPTDKDALKAYAEGTLKIKTPKTMSAINMAKKMVEAHQQADSAE